MSQTQLIHAQLREMLLSLDLRPGEKLSERWLEAQFGSSRTPVRAALLRLEAEELVVRDGRNWMVAPIDLGEIAALAEYRAPLEAAIARLACERAAEHDIAAIAEMLDACRPDQPREEWHRAGTDFHVELARLSGNPFMVKAIEGIMTRQARIRWLEVWTEEAREQAWREHRAILDLIRRKQPDAAAAAATDHVAGTRDRLLRSLTGDRLASKVRSCTVIAAVPAA